MIAKEHINLGRRENGDLLSSPVNPDAEIHLYGQEVNPETWAVSKSDLFIKDPEGPRCREHCLRHHAVQRCAHQRGTLTISLPIHPTGRTGSETRALGSL